MNPSRNRDETAPAEGRPEDRLAAIAVIALTFPEKARAVFDRLRFSTAEAGAAPVIGRLIEAALALHESNMTVTPEKVLEEAGKSRYRSGMGKGYTEAISDALEKVVGVPVDALELPDRDLEDWIRAYRAGMLRNRAEKAARSLTASLNDMRSDPFDSVRKAFTSLGTALGETSPLGTRDGGALKSLTESVETFLAMERRKKRDRTLVSGIDTGFRILTEKTGGFENELYLVAGGAGMGKSTFLIQLAWQLANADPDLSVILLSLDHRHLDVTTKFISQSAQLPAKYVKNPFIPDIGLETRRQEAVSFVSSLKERIQILDETHGSVALTDLDNLLHMARSDGHDKLVLVVDSAMKLENPGIFGFERHEAIAYHLKRLTRMHHLPVIASVNLPGHAQNRPPSKDDLASMPAFLYEPYAVFLLYCDFVNNFETPFLEWEWNTEDMMVPVMELSVIKNKMDEFRGKLFYRFYNSMSYFKECAQEEMDNYNDMLVNIEEWKSQQTPVSPTRPQPFPPGPQGSPSIDGI